MNQENNRPTIKVILSACQFPEVFNNAELVERLRKYLQLNYPTASIVTEIRGNKYSMIRLEYRGNNLTSECSRLSERVQTFIKLVNIQHEADKLTKGDLVVVKDSTGGSFLRHFCMANPIVGIKTYPFGMSQETYEFEYGTANQNHGQLETYYDFEVYEQ